MYNIKGATEKKWIKISPQSALIFDIIIGDFLFQHIINSNIKIHVNNEVLPK
jgi:hypothetical protein